MSELTSTSELWEKIHNSSSDKEYWWWIERETNGIRAKKIIGYIKNKFGSLKNLKTIEVGSGTGVYSLVLAKKGAQVTLLDYSTKALELANHYFNGVGLKANCVLGDALNFDKNLIEKFDIAMSFGTIEHFHYPERFLMAQAHYNLVKPGGVVIISVPNRWFFPHEILKYYLQKKDKWSLGYEGAFTRRELKKLAAQLQLYDVEIRGSAMLTDFQRYVKITINSRTMQRLFPNLWGKQISSLDYPSPFDDIFGADIVLLGRKRK